MAIKYLAAPNVQSDNFCWHAEALLNAQKLLMAHEPIDSLTNRFVQKNRGSRLAAAQTNKFGRQV
jgi:hypothetical protein